MKKIIIIITFLMVFIIGCRELTTNQTYIFTEEYSDEKIIIKEFNTQTSEVVYIYDIEGSNINSFFNSLKSIKGTASLNIGISNVKYIFYLGNTEVKVSNTCIDNNKLYNIHIDFGELLKDFNKISISDVISFSDFDNTKVDIIKYDENEYNFGLRENDELTLFANNIKEISYYEVNDKVDLLLYKISNDVICIDVYNNNLIVIANKTYKTIFNDFAFLDNYNESNTHTILDLSSVISLVEINEITINNYLINSEGKELYLKESNKVNAFLNIISEYELYEVKEKNNNDIIYSLKIGNQEIIIYNDRYISICDKIYRSTNNFVFLNDYNESNTDTSGSSGWLPWV